MLGTIGRWHPPPRSRQASPESSTSSSAAAVLVSFLLIAPAALHAAPAPSDPCPRPAAGSKVGEPSGSPQPFGIVIIG